MHFILSPGYFNEQGELQPSQKILIENNVRQWNKKHKYKINLNKLTYGPQAPEDDAPDSGKMTLVTSQKEMPFYNAARIAVRMAGLLGVNTDIAYDNMILPIKASQAIRIADNKILTHRTEEVNSYAEELDEKYALYKEQIQNLFDTEPCGERHTLQKKIRRRPLKHVNRISAQYSLFDNDLVVQPMETIVIPSKANYVA